MLSFIAVNIYNGLNNSNTVFVYLHSVCTVSILYSNKKEASDFHGTVSFDPVKISQQKINQNVNQTFDTQKMVII